MKKYILLSALVFLIVCQAFTQRKVNSISNLLTPLDTLTNEQSQRLIKSFYAWKNRFGTGIESSPNCGCVFSDIIRARSIIIKLNPIFSIT